MGQKKRELTVLLELGGSVTSSGAKNGFPSPDEEEESEEAENGDADEDGDMTDKGLLWPESLFSL